MPNLQLYRVHNEYDEERVLCEDCLVYCNDDVYDSREMFYQPVEIPDGECYECGYSDNDRGR